MRVHVDTTTKSILIELDDDEHDPYPNVEGR